MKTTINNKSYKELLQADLQNTIADLGQYGPNFVQRLEMSESIPKEQTSKDKSILNSLNEIAKSVPSAPYSAIFLRKRTLHIAQNQFATKEKREDLINRVKDHPEFKKLGNINEIKITRFRDTAIHPDMIAITSSIEADKTLNEEEPSYLGLARFSYNGKLVNQTPSSCACCGTAIKSLNKSGYNINVNRYTPITFPSNLNYKIPEIISTSPKKLSNYLNHLEDSINELDHMTQSNKEDLYAQYKNRDIKRKILAESPWLSDKIKDLDMKAKEEYRNNSNPSMIKKFNHNLEKFCHKINDYKTQNVVLQKKNDLQKEVQFLGNVIKNPKNEPAWVTTKTRTKNKHQRNINTSRYN